MGSTGTVRSQREVTSASLWRCLPHRARLPDTLAPPSLHHYSDGVVLRLDLDSGDEPTDHGHEVKEGVVLRFLRSEDGPDRSPASRSCTDRGARSLRVGDRSGVERLPLVEEPTTYVLGSCAVSGMPLKISVITPRSQSVGR
jgi:hypothetical protein